MMSIVKGEAIGTISAQMGRTFVSAYELASTIADDKKRKDLLRYLSEIESYAMGIVAYADALTALKMKEAFQ